MGSKFSIEQMMMTLSFRSRITSSSYSFQPLFSVVGDAAAGTAQGERGPHNDGKPNLARKFKSIFQIVNQCGFRHIEPDALHGIFKEEAVFGLLDRADVRSNQLHIVFVEHAAIGKLHRHVERSLAADGG